MEKYLYQKPTIEKGYLTLNREAINGEITGLQSTGMPCFLSTPEHIHILISSFSLFFWQPYLLVLETAKPLLNPPLPSLL